MVKNYINDSNAFPYQGVYNNLYYNECSHKNELEKVEEKLKQKEQELSDVENSHLRILKQITDERIELLALLGSKEFEISKLKEQIKDLIPEFGSGIRKIDI